MTKIEELDRDASTSRRDTRGAPVVSQVMQKRASRTGTQCHTLFTGPLAIVRIHLCPLVFNGIAATGVSGRV